MNDILSAPSGWSVHGHLPGTQQHNADITLLLIYVFVYYCSWDSLCISCCRHIRYVAGDDLEPLFLQPPPPKVLGSQVLTVTPGLCGTGDGTQGFRKASASVLPLLIGIPVLLASLQVMSLTHDCGLGIQLGGHGFISSTANNITHLAISQFTMRTCMEITQTRKCL